MKKILSLVLGVFIIGIGIISLNPESGNWLSASINEVYFMGNDVTQTSPGSPAGNAGATGGSSLETTDKAPNIPEYMNHLNAHAGELKSEEELLAEYKDDIIYRDSFKYRAFLPELILFAYRMKQNSILGNKLPIDPDNSLSTVGNVIAFLFAEQPNPRLFAILIGIIQDGRSSDDFLSRYEALEILTKMYFSPGTTPEEALSTLFQTGLVNEFSLWLETHHLGFHMVAFLRLVDDIREFIERKQILESKEKYENQMKVLPDSPLALNEDTLVILVRAFTQEANPGVAVPDVNPVILDSLSSQFANENGYPLTTDLITKVRRAYYETQGLSTEPVYMMKKLYTLGLCGNRLDKKTIMGAVAITPPEGSIFVCDDVIIHIPGNSYIINGYTFPKVLASANPDHPGRYNIRTDVLKSYANSFIVSPQGEEDMMIIYRPEGFESMIGEQFSVGIADRNGIEIGSIDIPVSDVGIVIKVRPRNYGGDNMIIAETL